MQPGRINETCSVPIIKDCNGVTMTMMMMMMVMMMMVVVVVVVVMTMMVGVAVVVMMVVVVMVGVVGVVVVMMMMMMMIRAFHKLLGNFLGASRISNNFFRFEYFLQPVMVIMVTMVVMMMMMMMIMTMTMIMITTTTISNNLKATEGEFVRMRTRSSGRVSLIHILKKII